MDMKRRPSPNCKVSFFMTSITEFCTHTSLTLDPSEFSSEAGFVWATTQKRAAAVTLHGRILSTASTPSRATFPAPLVLPEDELALDPDYPAQSLRSWRLSKERNHVTNERRTIYIAEPPSIDPSVEHIRSWTLPKKASTIPVPQTEMVIDYLAAFYHGLPVKRLPSQLVYTSWDTPSNTKSKRDQYVGLNVGTECVRIRTRTSKDLFAKQLNLDDLLDAAISLLPKDAYAILLIVSHDIYESDEDDFTCARAYGGSRVAVVSTARYNPVLDSAQNVTREHAWPASHCSAYMHSSYTNSLPKRKRKKEMLPLDNSKKDLLSGSIYSALTAHRSLPPLVSSSPLSVLSGLWLARICRTASHELGHCFGMDHCVFYACAMQGTASLGEDARQPPYLCPVDLTKVLQASSTMEESRYKALLAYCEKYQDVHHFSAFAAWIQSRLVEIKPT
ncbi:hypothetical protein BDP27DRAFT_783288 [Rhodocollybia butyracea]|uniref:Archaemetzincin-2 n=1 Tax=Rhodocollybia butyracea TaxID=206335 RepID=A0A9P5U673_9AGAR|nr:hypothetical protein BDP27DRAFT_783288 [Rhodocollybia butyracea]